MADVDGLLQKLVKGGILLFVGSMLQAALMFLMRAYVAQNLGKELYGVFTGGVSSVVIVSTILLLGVHRGVGRYLPRSNDSKEARGIVLSGAQLVIPTSLLVAVFGIVFVDEITVWLFGDASFGPFVFLLIIALPLAVLTQFSVGVVQGRQRSLPKLVIQNISRPVTAFLGVVIAIQLNYGLLGVGGAYLAGYFLAALVGGYYVLRLVPLRGDGNPVWIRRELLVFSLPLVAVTAIRVFFLDLDVVMLTALKDRADVGIYGGVFPLVKMFEIFLASFSFLAMPIFSELDLDQDYERMHDLYAVIAKWTFLCTLPLAMAFVLFPRAVIGLTFGPEYAEGANALRVLTIAFFVHASLGPNSNSLISLGKTRILMGDNLIAGAVNVGLNLLLIPDFSFFGAAVATGIGYVLRNVLVSYHLYEETGIHPLSHGYLSAGTASVTTGLMLAIVARTVFAPLPALAAFVVAFALALPVVLVIFGSIGRSEAALLEAAGERLGVNVDWLVTRVFRED